MLTPEELTEIQAELARYEQKRGGCIEALKTVQRHRGWISDETLAELADFLEMTPAELGSVSTFYNLLFRKPVGRHVILVCTSVSCWVMGMGDLLEHIEKKLGINLGETTADGRFTLLPNVCLGACDRAPVLMIDSDLYGDPDVKTIDEILAGYV
ncbi:MAG: NADH-quinone oxidoreductase subunit NuoE [Syntrophobacteraceae bacterium]|nr:NADH-quinone oxidoreductase subunit NuoE [Syntrophobacteraceae bacterium]